MIALTKIKGIPMMPVVDDSLALTQGRFIHVKPYSGSDSNDGTHPDKAVKTLVKALALATANQNDVVLLYAETVASASTTFDFLGAALDWNKNAVHLIGVCAGSGLGNRAGLRNSTSVATIEDLFTVSASGCLIKNIQIFHGDVTSTATSPRAMVVSGQRNKIENCMISGMGDTGASMDTAGARSLSVTGSENHFKDCYIGLDTCLRTTNKIEVDVTGTAASKATRNIFEDCVFNTYTAATDSVLVSAAYIDRFLLFKNCMFCCADDITSAATPTGVFSTANMNGRIWMYGGGCFGPADITTADSTAIVLLTYGALAANIIDMGVGKGTDVAA